MKNRKLMCSIMCLVMVLQLFVPAAFADLSTPSGTEETVSDSVYDIETVSDSVYDSETILDIGQPPTDEEEYRIWKEDFVAQLTPQPGLMSAMSVSGNRMYNDFLECAVASSGRFTMGTTGGNPDNLNDDYKKMLYGHPYPSTSYTTINIDGTSYVYAASSPPVFDSENNTCTSQYTAGELLITQLVSIVKNNSTQREDTVRIKYVVTNTGTSSHETGMRIMLDTMLGNNDYAPFRIPGIGAVTTETELSGDNIPEYWQAFDSLTSPNVISQGTLLSAAENTPDKVQFTNWRRVYNQPWGYTVNPSYSNGDSAVSVIWEPKAIDAGETQEYETYYGLSEFTQDLRPPLAVSITGASSVEAYDNRYIPNPFTVTTYIMNNGNAVANNVKVQIILPEGLSVVGGQNEVNLGDINPLKESQISCRVFIDNPSSQQRNLTYSIVVSADNAEPKTISRSIAIPPLNASDEMKYRAGLEGLENCTTWFVMDPVNAATGNFINRKTDISIDGNNPISFTRFYNTMDNWQGVLGLNWHNNYEYKLTSAVDKVQITFDDGHLEDFTLNADGTYSAMPGKYGILESLGSNGYALTQKDQTIYYFSPEGNLTAIEDIKGNRTELMYTDGKISMIQNECGSLQFEYDGSLISRITDLTGRWVEYGYTDGKLTSFTDVEGNTSYYEYDDKGRLVKVIDPLNNVTIANVYDDKDRTIEQTMADGVRNSFVYDDTEMTTTVIQGNGSEIISKRDSNYRIFERVYINGSEQFTFNDENQVTSFTDKNGNTYSYEYDNNGNITKETNPLGMITEYTYDDNNNVTSLKNPDGSIYIYEYDNKGNLLASIDPLGRTLSMEYNDKGLPVKIILPEGSYFEIEYDERGNAALVKDPLGNVSTFIYDTLNRVISVTKPEGNKVEYEYTPKGKVKKTIFPDGTYITATYDARGLVAEETDTNGGITKYTYNSMGKLIEAIDPAGGVTKYEYDNMWNVSKVTLPDGSITTYNYNRANQLASTKDAEGNVTSLEYDALDNVTKVTDPRGGVTQNSYDALSRLVQTENANNAVTRYEYRYDGKIAKVLDALNGAAEYTYDPAGQLVSVKDALGNTTAYTYNSLGLVASVRDAKGAETIYEYNPIGNVTKVTKPDGTYDTLSYDKNGNLTKVVDAKGNTTIYSYDNMDRLIKIQNPIGGTKTVSYTKTGQIAVLTDENNHTTTYKYDSMDRLIEVADAKDGQTKYSYDAVGNLTEVHRFGGITQDTINMMCPDKDSPVYQASSDELVTKYQYDRLGHVTQETNPAGKVIVYSYDANGNLVSKTDRDGYETKFEYDAVNNLKKTIYDDGKQVEYQYNPLNQVTGMTDWLGTNTFQLDKLGRVLKAVDYQNQVLEYTWSATGEKKSIKYPDGSMVNYEYDPMGRLTKVHDAQNKITAYNYDVLGNVVEKLLPNGCKTQYSYDELQRLTSMVNYDSNGTIADSYSYQYDAAGNMVKSNKNSEESLYQYDGLNQLQQVYKPDTTLEKYFYDKLGNRVRLETWKNGTYRYSADYQYDNLDRLIRVTGKGYNVLGNDEYTPHGINLHYDERGNIVQATTDDTIIEQFTFDASNRLVEAINKKGEKSTFTYDGSGRRVGMTYDINPSESIVAELSYLHDVTKPYDNVLEISGINIDESLRQYVYGLEMLSVDTTRQDGSENRLYYLHDELGSTVKLIDEAGLATAIFDYDEFGRPVKPNNVENWDKKGNVFSFTGYQLDASTGLMYAQARYYMPAVGRFISEDAYKGKVIETQSLNLYVYVINNPLKYIDPTGNMTWRQTDDLVYGIGDSVKDTVKDTIKTVFSLDTYVGLWDLGKAIYNGDISAYELISAIGESAIEPVNYMWDNANYIFLGNPCDQEVRNYGRKTGEVLQAVVGSAAATKLVLKVAPKLKPLLTSMKKGTSNTVVKSVDDILDGATAGRVTKGKTTQYIKPGDFNQASNEFDSLNPSNVKNINTSYGQGKTGTLPDGRTVTVRPGSTDGRPTLEIRNPNGRGIEIRYGE